MVSNSHSIPSGFQIEYSNAKGNKRTWNNRTSSTAKVTPSIVTGFSGPVTKLVVSQIANQTPAPASVATSQGCNGPKFEFTRAQLMNNAKDKIVGGPVTASSGWTIFVRRKMSKSECQKFLRNEACGNTQPSDGKSFTYGSKQWAKRYNNSYNNGVLPVVQEPNVGFGCVHSRAKKFPSRQYKLVWNVGCKGSTIQCGGGGMSPSGGTASTGGRFSTIRTAGDGRSDATVGPAWIRWTDKKSQDAGLGIFHNTKLNSAYAKNNDKSNWDEFNIPIEAGDGIPRKKKAAPAPKPKPKPIPNPLDGKLCEWSKDVTKTAGSRAPGCKYWETRRNTITSVSGQVLGLRSCQDARWGGSWGYRLTAAGRKQLGM